MENKQEYNYNKKKDGSGRVFKVFALLLALFVIALVLTNMVLQS
jgi:hypothetical protein